MLDIKSYEMMAKLDLPEEERRWVAEKAGILIERFRALEGVNTEETPPLVTVLDVCNVLREDIKVKEITREELLENAPSHGDGFFLVPRTR